MDSCQSNESCTTHKPGRPQPSLACAPTTLCGSAQVRGGGRCGATYREGSAEEEVEKVHTMCMIRLLEYIRGAPAPLALGDSQQPTNAAAEYEREERAMSKRITQPRNRHIVAVIALLISSVEGFAPQARQTHRYDSSNTATCTRTTAIAAAAWSSAQQQTSRHPMRQRGPCDGVGARRRSGALCQERWGFGLGGEGPAADQRARKLFPPGRGPAAGSAAARPGSFSSRSYRRGSSSLSMALHFPRPPRLPKPPPPGDKAPLAGGGKSGSAGSTSSTSHHESQKQQQTATTPGGLLPQPAAGKSGGGAAASEGMTGVLGLDAKEGKDSAGHANGTRTDLNGSKVREGALEKDRTLVWPVGAKLSPCIDCFRASKEPRALLSSCTVFRHSMSVNVRLL